MTQIPCRVCFMTDCHCLCVTCVNAREQRARDHELPSATRAKAFNAVTARPSESSAEYAAYTIHCAIMDFIAVVNRAETSNDAIAIHRIISGCCLALGRVEDASLLKADALCLHET